MKALFEQHWILKSGVRLAKAHFSSPLYALSVSAKAALTLNKKDLNDFIQTAPENQLEILIEVLSVCQ